MQPQPNNPVPFDWMDSATASPGPAQLGELGSLLSKFVKRNKESLIRAGLVTGAAAAFFIPVVGPVVGPLALTASAALNPKGSQPTQPTPANAAGVPLILLPGGQAPQSSSPGATTAQPASAGASLNTPVVWAAAGIAALLLLRR